MTSMLKFTIEKSINNKNLNFSNSVIQQLAISGVTTEKHYAWHVQGHQSIAAA